MTFDRHVRQEVHTDLPKEQVGYIFSYAAITLIVIAIFRSRGAFTCCAVLAYLLALSTMSLVLKFVFVEQRFDYPLWITSVHFLCTSSVAFVVLWKRSITTGKPITVLKTRTLLRGVGPVALCFSLSVGLCNKGLSLSNAHFYEMVDTATPLVACVLTVLMGKPFPLRLTLPVFLVTVSLACCWTGEAHFSMLAFICLMSGTILRAFKGVLNQMLMSANETQVLQPVELVMYTGLTSLFFMGTWSLLSEGVMPWLTLYAAGVYPAGVTIALSALNAVVINFSGIFVIRDLGAVAQQLTGCLKSVLTVIGGVAVRGEFISPLQACAYIVLIIAIAWYNHMDKVIKEEETEEKHRLVERSKALVR